MVDMSAKLKCPVDGGVPEGPSLYHYAVPEDLGVLDLQNLVQTVLYN